MRQVRLHDYPHLKSYDRQQLWSQWVSRAYPDDEEADQNTIYTVEGLDQWFKAQTRHDRHLAAVVENRS